MTRNLTIERTMLIILFLLLFALATRIPLDTDMWWHLRSGEYMLENRTVLHDDQFSHTFTGVERTHYEWASQIILYGIYAVSGFTGLALFTSGLATAGMAVLYRASEGSTYLRAFVMILGASAAAVFWSARPQMFSFLFSAVMIYLLYRYKRLRQDDLWWVVPLMFVWGNLHAGFSIGLILLYGTIGGEVLNNLLRSRSPYVIEWARLPRLVIVSALGTGVLLLNPAGLDLLLVPFETVTIGPLRQFIQEWLPPVLTRPETLPFVALMMLTAGLLLARWRQWDWTEAALAGGSAFLALGAARNISFFAAVATPIVTYHLNAILEARGWVLKTVRTPTRRMIRLNVILIAFIVIGALAKVLLALDPDLVTEAYEDSFPVNAIAFIDAQQPPGPLFNSYNWGGYIMFHLRDYPVYIDGRTDLYRDFVLDYYNTMIGAADWRTALNGINLVFIESGSGLDQLLREEPGWSLAYEDTLAVVYTRDA